MAGDRWILLATGVLWAGSVGYGMKALSARDFVQKSEAWLVINGGFFQEDLSPLGLMIQKGKELNPLRRVEWGVFSIAEGTPKIVHTRAFIPGPNIVTALQSGPRLVIGGVIPTLLSDAPAPRSAVGITQDNQVILATTQNTLLDMKTWANFLKSYCSYALNLDGGGSAQLYFKHDGHEVHVAGTTPVPNALGIFAKD